MISKITSKYQITIPSKIRRILKLNISDSIEWKLEKGKVIVETVENNFLKHRASVKINSNDIRKDIEKARDLIAKNRHEKNSD
jgi:bifunctional DNA-binding transcriptional regulator/antitoxin component of YhaV-PrlF toxin-antitoxin module